MLLPRSTRVRGQGTEPNHGFEIRFGWGSSASGPELVDMGYPADVEIAAEVDESAVVAN